MTVEVTRPAASATVEVDKIDFFIGPSFAGREVGLARLDAGVSAKRTAALTKSDRAARLSGLGGVGKSLHNTPIFYISGDSDQSAEGSKVSSSEVRQFNGIEQPVGEQMKWYNTWAIDETYSHNAVTRGWAFDTPFKWTKQIPSFFGGTRRGMVVSWPGDTTNLGVASSNLAPRANLIYFISNLEHKSQSKRSVEIVQRTPAELKKCNTNRFGEPLIALCVCTCGRPRMLRRCLSAISNLTPPASADLAIIVVDNESEPNNRSVVEEFPGFVHQHEPRRGISNARNAAIEAALALNADFIAFTDDDAEPAEYWLDQLLEVQREVDADVVRGRTVCTYPDPLPRWILESNRSKQRNPEEIKPEKPIHVRANNVLFSAHLVHKDGFNLRFDPRFNTTRGGDTDFFTKAWERGVCIVASDLPVVFEQILPERCTYWRQIRRQYEYATANTIIDLDRKRHLLAALGAAGRLFAGGWWMIVALVLGVSSPRRFRKHALMAGKKAMYAAGQLSVLAGYRYEGYRVIDGL